MGVRLGARGRRGAAGSLRATRQDGVVLLHPGGAGDIGSAAAALPCEPGRVTVVVAPGCPAEHVLGALEAVLASEVDRGTASVRLVLGNAGRDRPDRHALARDLADRFGLEVVAPDGAVTETFFVVRDDGEGRWLAFRPGEHRPQPRGARWPVPPWEPIAVPAVAGVEVRHVPAGLLVRPVGGTPVPPTHPVFSVTAGAEPVVFVQTAPVSAFLRALRGPWRLALCGDVDVQAVADELGREISCYQGLPKDGRVVALDRAGAPAWWPFATRVEYRPALPPRVLECVPPVAGLDPVEAAVFRLADGVVAEVVPAGLWIRPETRPRCGVRVEPMDPDWVHVHIGLPGTEPGEELWREALRLVDALPAAARTRVRFRTPPAPPVPDGPGPVAPAAEPEANTPRPSVLAPLEPFHLTAARPPAEQERLSCKNLLGDRYAAHLSALSSVLARVPVLRGIGTGSANTDLVAARAMACAGWRRINAELERDSAVRDWATCSVAGLRRLPVHRGPVFLRLDSPVLDACRPGDVVVAHGFLAGHTSEPGEVIVWSSTARKLAGLVVDDAVEDVVFLPGTRFVVSAGGMNPGGPDHRFLLRELVTGGPEDGAQVAMKLESVAALGKSLPPISAQWRERCDVPMCVLPSETEV